MQIFWLLYLEYVQSYIYIFIYVYLSTGNTWFFFSERNKFFIDDMQTLDDHEALRSRSYMMVVLRLHYWYILGKVCVHIYTYVNMYVLIAICTVHQNLVCVCLCAFLMYAFLEDVWFSSVLQWRLCLKSILDL